MQRIEIEYGMWFCATLWSVIVLSIWHWTKDRPSLNVLGSKRSGRHFSDDIFRWFSYYKSLHVIQTSPNIVLKSAIDYKPSLAQVMARRRKGPKPLPGPMTQKWINYNQFSYVERVKLPIVLRLILICIFYVIKSYILYKQITWKNDVLFLLHDTNWLSFCKNMEFLHGFVCNKVVHRA